MLIWTADGRTLEDCGLRACVALYCIRPDLIDSMTLGRNRRDGCVETDYRPVAVVTFYPWQAK